MKRFTETTLTEAIQRVKDMDFKRPVSFDVETADREFPGRWIHGGSYEQGNPTGMSVCNGKQSVYVDTCGWTKEEAMQLLEVVTPRLYGASSVIAQNCVFDLSVLWKYGFQDDSITLFDTMVAAHLIDEERKYKGGLGLKALAEVDLGATEVKSWDETRFDKEQFHKYAHNDAIWAFALAVKYRKELVQQELDYLFDEIEMPFQWVLLQMEMTGVPVDNVRASAILGRSAKQLAQYQSELYDMLGIEHTVIDETEIGVVNEEELVNFNSPQQVADKMVGLGIELTETTPTGRYSLKGEVLEKLPEHPFIDTYLKYKALNHTLSHFIKKLPKLVDEDGRMRPNWNNCGTVTGRLSSSKPNFQNLPKPEKDPVGVRDCVSAPGGKVLIACDYSGQEVAVLAHLSQDPELVDRMNNGFDMHLSMANDLHELGIPEECLKETHSEYERYKKQYKWERQTAKDTTFGLAYGQTEHGLSEKLNITKEEALQIQEKYSKAFPLIKKAVDEAHAHAHRYGFVVQHYGRRRRFKPNKWGRRDSRAMRQAFNFLVQSPSSDMIRKASVNCYNVFKARPEWNAKLIMSVHDEVIVECDEEHAQEVADEMVRQFIKAADDYTVRFRADVAIGKTYAECK